MRANGNRAVAAGLALVAALLAATMTWARWPRRPSSEPPIATTAARAEWIELPAGRMPAAGSATPLAREVAAFRLARHEVTNRQFAEFVAATGYRTTAEHAGGAMVFDAAEHKWVRIEGASWRRPAGRDSSIAGRDDYPVVQVSWFDASAYAKWRGARLPTQLEWEYAARGQQRDATYPWGAVERPQGRYRANYWQGWFPDRDLGHDGYAGLSPVGAFPPTGAGFSDLAGNVWEWCAERFDDSLGGEARALRGGSWTSAENFLPGYEIAFRRGLPPDAAYQDVGFRVAWEVAGDRP